MRRLILIITLLAASIAGATTTQKLYELPVIETVRDASKLYIFDSLSGSRNITAGRFTSGAIFSHTTSSAAHTKYLLKAGGKVGSATDYSEFEADGSLSFHGAATTYQDLLGAITAIKVTGTGVSLNDTEATIDFTASANLSDYAWIPFQVNHQAKLGAALYPHIHWQQTSSSTPNWLMRYRWQANNAAKTTAWTDYKCNTNAFSYTSGTFNQISYGAALTPPVGYGISDIVQVRVFRDTANTSGVFTGADPATGTIGITSVDLHLEVDSTGSRTEYTK